MDARPPTSARRSGRTRSAGSATWCWPPRGIPRCSSTSTTGCSTRADLVVPRGPERGPARGAQRELRARADGAAHPRRGRRLHPAGRDRGGALLHRLDASTGRSRAGASSSGRWPTTAARSACSARCIPAGGGREDGERVIDILARHPVDRALHRHQARAPLRERRSAAGPGGARGPDLPATPTASIRAVAGDDPHVAGVLVGRGLPGQDQDAARGRGERGARARRARSWPAAPGPAGSATAAWCWRARWPGSASRSTRRSRPPAIPTGGGLGQHRRAARPHELRAGPRPQPPAGRRAWTCPRVVGGRGPRPARPGAGPRCCARGAARRGLAGDAARCSRPSSRARRSRAPPRRPGAEDTDVEKLAALVLGSPEFQRR